jgi:hypothetical protein
MADGVHGGNDHIGVLVQDKHSQRGRVAADLSGRVEDDKCAGGDGRKDAKYLAQTFSLPDVQVGSIIEYDFNYNFEDNYIFASDWILSEELFTKVEVFSLKPYTASPGMCIGCGRPDCPREPNLLSKARTNYPLNRT